MRGFLTQEPVTKRQTAQQGNDSGLRHHERAHAKLSSNTRCHYSIKLPYWSKSDRSRMLDTVKITGPWQTHDRMPARCCLRVIRNIRVRTDGSGGNIVWAEASLPRLVFGHNGRVLADQTQINEALNKLRNELSNFALVPPVSQFQARRVDIAWNFPLVARPPIMAHGYLRVPTIRRGPTRFPDDTGISWRAAGSQMVLTMYDKSKQMHVPGSVLRVELSLRNHRLRERFAGTSWQSLDKLWEVFREVLSGIAPIQTVQQARNWLEAIAPESPEVRGRILSRLEHKSERTRRRYAQRLEVAAARIDGRFCWAEFLPIDAPPSPVQVEPASLSRRRGTSGTIGPTNASEFCSNRRKHSQATE
jgi:replication protein CRI